MAQHRLFILFLLFALAGCEALPEDAAGESPVVAPDQGGFEVRQLAEGQVEDDAAAMERQRLIADILFEGLQALDADRLLTPLDDNAHARFQRVLAYDPDNEIALQGLQDIVARYIELSREAIQQGLFDEAEFLLGRARFVDETDPAIAGAWLELQAEKESGDLFFDLDGREVTRRTENIQQQLADIGRQAREHDAFFLITAPSDELARWMYAVMREAVDGYRLRGNIELASRTSIRLRMPESTP